MFCCKMIFTSDFPASSTISHFLTNLLVLIKAHPNCKTSASFSMFNFLHVLRAYPSHLSLIAPFTTWHQSNIDNMLTTHLHALFNISISLSTSNLTMIYLCSHIYSCFICFFCNYSYYFLQILQYFYE